MTGYVARKTGKTTSLSGALDILAQELTRFVKADHFIACTAIDKDGYFTCDIMPPVHYGDLKRDIVLRYAVVKPGRSLYGIAEESEWEVYKVIISGQVVKVLT